MKILKLKFIVILAIFVQLTSCTNKQNTDSKEENSTISTKIKKGALPKMDFNGKNIVDLGKIKEGEKISHTYTFTNTGDAPLQIGYANASCGCTVPTWPKEPIAVGGKGNITVEFNSKNKEGKLFKNVSIYSNTVPEFNTVAFNIEVVKNK